MKVDRRGFIAGGLASLLAARRLYAKTDVRVVVVGAGLAGLVCVDRLKQAGIDATLIEGSNRVGGRVFSLRGHYPAGQVAELGGELLDSGHIGMMSLAARFGLQVDDLFAGRSDDSDRDTYVVEHEKLTRMQLAERFTPMARAMRDALASAEVDEIYRRKLNAMSIAEWMDHEPDVERATRCLIDAAYVGEFGLELHEQSALNLFELIDWENPTRFALFGDSDERYHIHEGNDAIASGLARGLSDIETSARLIALSLRPDKRYALTVTRDVKTWDIVADHVVLALPFSTLRDVDCSKSGIADDKLELIRKLGYGKNTKLMAGFEARVWNARGANGSVLTGDGLQTFWDTSRGQAGSAGLLTHFVGGEAARYAARGTAEERWREDLGYVEFLFPGVAKAYIKGSATRMCWEENLNARGSYACAMPGQYGYAQLAARREGNVHFCGEHTSFNFAGWMEGAVETGALAALEVIG